MSLMTVQEYAKFKEISPQAVYGLIKREKLQVQIKDGLKMIEVKTKQKNKKPLKDCKKLLNKQKRKTIKYKHELKMQQRYIKLLEQQIEKIERVNNNIHQTSQKMISFLSDKITPGVTHIDAEIIKKKKKKK